MVTKKGRYYMAGKYWKSRAEYRKWRKTQIKKDIKNMHTYDYP